MENSGKKGNMFSIALDTSPKEADVAIVSIDKMGTPGALNLFVLNELGYSESILSQLNLEKGYDLFKLNGKPIIFIVTVGSGGTDDLLVKNLSEALQVYMEFIANKKVWIPLMGTGAGNLSFDQSYKITVDVLNKIHNNYKDLKCEFLISIPNSNDGKLLFNRIEKGFDQVISETKETIIADSIIKSILNSDSKYYLVGSNWEADDQSERFYIEKVWQNGYEEGQYAEIINAVKIGDILINKSTFATKKGENFLRFKGLGVVTKNSLNGTSLDVEWIITKKKIDIVDLSFYRQTIVEPVNEDLNTIFLALKNTKNNFINDNLFKQISESILKDSSNNQPYSPIIQNDLQRTNINNDGSQSENDLLGFKNDIRAFASLIALKELKPPLAIALFGKWGTGKSFFMHNLQKQIEFLSIHQGFEEIKELKNVEAPEESIFCDGVVQITFNAWSYMDANLWASLVANIFEKLDEYISEQSKGKTQQEKAREILSKELTIVSEEKDKIVAQRNLLLNEKTGLVTKINEIELQKKELLEQAAEKKYDEIYAQIKKEIPLEEDVRIQLKKYGITEEKINTLSYENLYGEAKSWVRFIKNIMEFNKWQLTIMGLGCFIIILTILNPNDVITRFVSTSRSMILSFFAVAGPLFVNFYSTLQRFMKIYEPVKNYKNKFNQEIDIVILQYDSDIKVVNESLKQKNDELNNTNSFLKSLNEKIDTIESELGDSITGKAFFDFIKNKSKDDKYDKNLSIITTIRRDFETLSELFSDYNIPPQLNETEQKRAERKKEQSVEFKSLFKKPLDRVVLYVDDLDRCPEDRVIEVLEAVNLLMAYPLFVVVVGVDPRWVKNALIKKYTLQFTGLLNANVDMAKHGVEPIHVTDYLEKIFQIPFHLNEADSAGLGRLLDNIFENQIKQSDESDIVEDANQPSKKPDDKSAKRKINIELSREETEQKILQPQDLKLTYQELENLKEIAWLIGNNPRSLKRYANMYRIVRAHESLSYNKDQQEKDFLAIMFVLALSIGEYKTIAQQFFTLCNENPIMEIHSLLKKIDNIDKIEKIDTFKNKLYPENINTLTGETLSRFMPFVKRFSFENIK